MKNQLIEKEENTEQLTPSTEGLLSSACRPSWVRIPPSALSVNPQQEAVAVRGENPLPYSTSKASSEIIQLLIHLKSQGYSEATLRGWSRRLSYLAKYSNLQDPEAVKRFIAEQQWSSGYKGNMVNAYQHYVDFCGLSWSKPFYERVDKIQRILRTEDINKIISGASLQYALAFSIIRDTGLRPIECSWLRLRDGLYLH